MKIHRRRDIEPRQRKKASGVFWYVRTPKDLISFGSIRTRQFAAKKDADAFAEQLRKARQSGSSEFFKLPQSEQSEVLRLLGEFGISFLIEACRLHRERKPDSDKSVTQLLNDCIAAKEQAGVRDNSISSLRCSLESFADSTTKAISNIAPEDIDKWLANGVSVKTGEAWSAKTRLGRLKDVSAMFTYAVKRGILSANPALAVEPPKVQHKPAAIFVVKECEAFLKACIAHDVAFLGYVVPILFAGVRPEESERMTKDMVKDGALDLSGDITKKRQRRVIVLNDTAKAWLSIKGVKFGNINITRRRRRLAKLAGVEWSHDVLRHSFCSYALPIYGARVTSEMAANSENVIFSNYREIVSKADADAFWGLRPA